MKRKIVVSLMILMFPMLVGCQKETMTLKIDSVTVEYGSSISVKAEDYLKNEKDFLDKVEVAVNAENEKDKSYTVESLADLAEDDDTLSVDIEVFVQDVLSGIASIKAENLTFSSPKTVALDGKEGSYYEVIEDDE